MTKFETNIRLALACWATVPPYQVDLDRWRTCGSIHCFGGWLPAFPQFADMGVCAKNSGVSTKGLPCMYIDGKFIYGTEVAVELFNEADLFLPRTQHDDPNISDWEVIQQRLERLLRNYE